MQLHERLRVTMALYNVRPRELARRVGLDEGYISRILAGKQACPPATLTRLIMAIHADVLREERPKAAA